MSTANITTDRPSVESPSNRFYRTVWRWHFYAGLFVIPFMLMLALTGIIYLFKPQLDAAMYRNLMFVQPGGAVLPYTQQVDAAKALYPDAAISKIIPSVAANRSTEVEIKAGDRTLMVFVNPYTGKVLGDRDENQNLQSIARKLHGELMIGKVGDYLIELAACWGLVLLITGLYLWLPRKGLSVWGTLLPRLGNRNRRIFWRDLHAVPGLYGGLLIGFLILTGLPWTGFWGETFAQVWNQFPAQMWNDVPQSTQLTGSLNQNGQNVPWAVEQMPLPLSQKPSQMPSQSHDHSAGHSASGHAEAAPVTLNSVIALAQTKGVVPGFNVTLPGGETGVYTVSAFPDNPAQEATLHIDQYSGAVLADVRWQQYGLVPKAVELGIAIHMGKYFGLANQLLMLFACLVILLLCVSGVVLWWKRRPADRLGAPPLPEHVQQWRIPLAIVAISGLAFPLVGLSLVTVLLLDYGVFSRIPALRRLLG
ncbi:MAG: PepSY domain-containing protein [Oscillatoriophycideae cyanobacterium NC_groundwater_1537_Pr4_S-0.65um_50_18]|nr:PepSY domain-containing protein [Oscillatoriophycideae cyanobacterium NC_groundwater_1537_Pr4_S-0.65um_50_18]